ncbi:hypothetical protein TNCV_2281971 [Trichonephila clavipes]|nr:hypothetical protein TNCV_2281971 [Trichonephila clavipes]
MKAALSLKRLDSIIINEKPGDLNCKDEIEWQTKHLDAVSYIKLLLVDEQALQWAVEDNVKVLWASHREEKLCYNIWILDSGGSCHMAKESVWFKNISPEVMDIYGDCVCVTSSWDLIEDTVIKLEYIQTEFLIADFRTKAMSVEKMESFSYTRAFGDRPRHFEPWSCEEEGTSVAHPPSPNYQTTPTRGRLALDRFNIHRPLHVGSSAVLGSNS